MSEKLNSIAYQKLLSACVFTILELSYLLLSSSVSAHWLTSERHGRIEGKMKISSQVRKVAQQPATQQPSNPTRGMKSFLDWCQKRDSLTLEAKHTVEVILERIRIQDCQQAHQKLLTQRSLNLSNHLQRSQIEDISALSSLTHLEELDLKANAIKDLTPLSPLVNLQTLYLEYGTSHNKRNILKHGETPLDLTPLASLKKLQKLHLTGNVITNLTPLASLKNLRTLILHNIAFPESAPDTTTQYSRKLDLTPLSNLTNLEEIHISANPNIENFTPLSSLINLRLLNLSESNVKDITFLSSLTNLEELYLIQNEIKDIAPLSGLKKLQKLYLFHNREIEDIKPLSALTKLQKLFLGNNQIKDVTPLSSLTNLQELELWENQITDVTPLSSLNNLLVLNLNSNIIQDITPLSSLTNLQVLRLDNNRYLDKKCPLPRKSICVWTFK